MRGEFDTAQQHAARWDRIPARWERNQQEKFALLIRILGPHIRTLGFRLCLSVHIASYGKRRKTELFHPRCINWYYILVCIVLGNVVNSFVWSPQQQC